MAKLAVINLLKIFKASYSAVLPDKIIKKCLTYNPNSETLSIIGDKFNLCFKKVYVVGAGKAVQYMAREINDLLGSKIKRGIISIPAESLSPDNVSSNIRYCEGAKHNLPDADAEVTAKQIMELASNLHLSDFLLVLISGGGSALLPLPKEPITLSEKKELIKKLANTGADIKELNTVRKKLSAIKGGKLAITASPALIVTLVLSDVVGDPLDIIASGPTVEDKDDVEKAIAIIKKYDLYEDLPDSIKKVLEMRTIHEDFPVDRVLNYVLGSNKMSILAAHNEAKHNNYVPIVLSKTVTGDINDIAKEYVKLSKLFGDYLKGKYELDLLTLQVESLKIPGIKTDFIDSVVNIPNPREKDFCLILGGETTVTVKGTGKGGRNQQLALEFSNVIHQAKDDFAHINVYMLSAGTDGIDGPTDAAGAIGYLDLVSDCQKTNIDIKKYLENNDSYNFYKNFKDGLMHVITGHTNTNVMDMHFILIQKSQ